MSQIPPAQPGVTYGQPQPPKKKSHKVLWIVLSCGGAFVVLICAIGGVFVKGVGDAVDQAGKPNAVSSHSAAPAGDDSSVPDDPDTDDPAPTGPEKLKVGGEISVSQDGLDSAAATIGVDKVTRNTGPATEWGEGPANGTFVVFTVTVKGDSGKFEFNPTDFYVRGSDGAHYDMGDGNAYEAVADGNTLDYTTVSGGEHTSGPVPFDTKSGHGTLVYDPNYSGDPLAEWSF